MKRFAKGLLILVAGLTIAGGATMGIRTLLAERDRRQAALAPQGRLPEGVRPLHYDLRLRIDPDQSRFSGSVGIDVEVDRESTELWIHGERIDAERAVLELADGRVLPLTYREMGHSGVVRLTSEGPIPAGRSRIEIDYSAAFDTRLEALYVVEADSERYVFSQLEAIDARQIFPGFDEPRFKVPFDLVLEVRNQHEGITATPAVDTTDLGDGFRRIEFATTPPLPTYLLAFAVGPLDVVEAAPIPPSALRSHPIPLRGIAVRGKGPELAYALEHTPPLVLALEAYFGRAYPYRKLDIAAVPDFGFGAMENVGLIVYRETLLLLGENPSVADLRSYTNVHAHELAHQWFGNLVTMPWWDDIWLNESFATWMGNRVANEANPEFEFDRETTRNGHAVMGIDVYTDSRRIREPVEGREEIANAFDWISYAKGGAFLQMMESWIGPETFRQGIRGYLERHAHGNATADDFLEALEGVAAGRPVRRVAKSFLEQRGLPLVAVDWHCEEGRTHFALEQTRYLEAGSRIDPAMGWVQPFCARLIPGDGNNAAGERVCTLIEGRSHSFTVDTPSCPAAVFPNAQGAGYYRWTLTAEAWRALLDRLGSLHPAEKFSAASNLAAEFRSGRLSGSAYLEAIRPIVAQSEWDVATQPIDTLTFLSDFVASAEEKPALAAFVGALYAPHLSEDPVSEDPTGPQAESGNEIARRLLREEVLYLLALTLREPKRLDVMAQHGFEAIGYGSDGELNLGAVDGDLLEIALASAVESEGEPFFSALVDHLDNSQDGSFRNKAIRALGLTTEPELASELRSLGFLSSLRLNEIPTLLRAQASRVENRPALFAWLKRAFRWGRGFMPEGYLSRVPFLASGFCDAESRADFRDYFSAYEAEIPGLGRNLAQAVESIELCENLVRLQDGLIVPAASSLE